MTDTNALADLVQAMTAEEIGRFIRFANDISADRNDDLADAIIFIDSLQLKYGLVVTDPEGNMEDQMRCISNTLIYGMIIMIVAMKELAQEDSLD